MRQLMKWGAMALIVGAGVMHWYKNTPRLVQQAIQAELTAVHDDYQIIKDAVDGNTRTINDLADKQGKQAAELAQKIEQNHQQLVSMIDGTVSGIGRLIGAF